MARSFSKDSSSPSLDHKIHRTLGTFENIPGDFDEIISLTPKQHWEIAG